MARAGGIKASRICFPLVIASAWPRSCCSQGRNGCRSSGTHHGSIKAPVVWIKNQGSTFQTCCCRARMYCRLRYPRNKKPFDRRGRVFFSPVRQQVSSIAVGGEARTYWSCCKSWRTRLGFEWQKNRHHAFTGGFEGHSRKEGLRGEVLANGS